MQLIFYYAFNLFSPLFIHINAIGLAEELIFPLRAWKMSHV